MNILVISRAYLPGFKFGGPIRTIAAIVDQLGQDLRFWIVTADRDAGDAEPYSGIVSDTWQQVGNARVYYKKLLVLSPFFLRSAISTSQADLIYLNSFFDPLTSMVLVWRRLGLIPRTPVLLAPRGEFSEAALGIRARKKQRFLALARRFGLYEDIHWHASTQREASEIAVEFPNAMHVHVAPNLSSPIEAPPEARTKDTGSARFVFFARVSPMKNLQWALERLRAVKGDISLAIHGPISDPAYWERCKEVIQSLPPNVLVEYRGEMSPDRLHQELVAHHFLLFPSLGENFGHTIAEALQLGMPVLISDRTPWSGLEHGNAGWDIPLEDPARWERALQDCVCMEQTRYDQMSRDACAFGNDWRTRHGGAEQMRAVFEAVR